MGIFESHAHYDDEAFNEDRRELLKELPEKGIEYVVNVGASMESTKSSIALAGEYDYIYAAVGVHPNETAPLTEEFIQYMNTRHCTIRRLSPWAKSDLTITGMSLRRTSRKNGS